MQLNLIKSAILMLLISSCQVQTKKQMSTNTNPLLCDPEIGACLIGDSTSALIDAELSTIKPVKIMYFTDPICSSCWGIEPQLRRLKLEYGDRIQVEYHMGGLLRDWSYNSGGISKPSDVAIHWDEVSVYYDMPIDGDVWLEDPLSSSYPSSIAFKAAQLQNDDKALLFLRKMREMVFLQKKNISQWQHINEAALFVGLDAELLKKDYDSAAVLSFQADLKMAANYGVRAFPTLLISDTSGNSLTVVGARPYEVLEDAIKKLDAEAKKSIYKKDWVSMFAYFKTMTAREFSELSGMPKNETESYLDQLVKEGNLKCISTKNGKLWMRS